MLRASIDIGSNSTLLLIAEVENHSIKKIILNEANVTSLGKDLDHNKVFIQESMDATFSVLKEYKNFIDKYQVKEVIATATEASRVAKNADEFFSKVKKEIGIDVTIINAEGEAHYTALGVVSQSKQSANDFIVMDIGGASTELIKIQKSPFEKKNSISLPIGAVRATDWMEKGEFEKRLEDIFKSDLSIYETQNLVCVAGSMTTLGAMFLGNKIYDDDIVNGTKITFSEFESFVEEIKGKTPQELLGIYPFVGKRAPFIVGGAIMCLEISKKLKVETFEISTSGLRYGTLLSGVIDGKFLN